MIRTALIFFALAVAARAEAELPIDTVLIFEGVVTPLPRAICRIHDIAYNDLSEGLVASAIVCRDRLFADGFEAPGPAGPTPTPRNPGEHVP